MTVNRVLLWSMCPGTMRKDLSVFCEIDCQCTSFFLLVRTYNHQLFSLFQTYIQNRKDINLMQMIEKFGVFVVPTMHLVNKVLKQYPTFKKAYAGLAWESYLGNWVTQSAGAVDVQQKKQQESSSAMGQRVIIFISCSILPHRKCNFLFYLCNVWWIKCIEECHWNN